MGTNAFERGTAFEYDRSTFRLARKVADTVWQAENLQTGRIIEFTDEELRARYVSRELKFFLSPALRPRTEVSAIDLEAPIWKKAKLRRAYVKAVEHLPNTAALIDSEIEATWKRLKTAEPKPHASTVLRWKRRYLTAGGNIEALIDQSDRKGNRQARYPETEVFVRDLIERRYLSPERATVRDIAVEATALIARENRERLDSDKIAVPSERLVHRLIHEWSAYDRYAARYGADAARNHFRNVKGHTITSRPLERAEIDHTRLDLILVNDQGLPLGRPHITACIDTYTRCLLGIYVGFEPPSYLTVAKCLKHAMLPKTGLRKEFPDIVNDWSAHGVMTVLVVDNGREFHSDALEKASEHMGIDVQFAARKHSWFKGTIERWFRSLNTGLTHRMPGTTYSNIFEKGEIDPTKHAIMTLSTFKKALYKWVVDVYHQKPHRGIGNNTPARHWTQSIKPELIKLPDDPARLDALLGAAVTRRLTHHGIELKGLFYNGPGLEKLRRLRGSSFDVQVRYDPADLGAIVVLDPSDSMALIPVDALEKEYAQGLSVWQHKVIRDHAARELDKYDQEGWREAKAAIMEMVDRELHDKRRRTRSRAARFAGEDNTQEGNERPVEANGEECRGDSDDAGEGGAASCDDAADLDVNDEGDFGAALDDEESSSQAEFEVVRRPRRDADVTDFDDDIRHRDESDAT